MYQIVLANYDFTFIDGGEYETIEEVKECINYKLNFFQDSIYCRIENVFVKTEVEFEYRQIIGFQELKSIQKENSYIILATYNRQKNRWDISGTSYTLIKFPNYSNTDKEFQYNSFGDILIDNMDSINSFQDPERLKEYIVELFIYNHTDPKLIYNKILYLRQRRTVEAVIKFCYDTILASEKLIAN